MSSTVMERSRRGLSLGLVLGLLAGMLVVVGSFVVAPSAQARYATGGSGAYKGVIDWFEWGNTEGARINVPMTRTNTRVIQGQDLTTTCTIANLVTSPGGATISVRTSGAYKGDGLDDLYNIGGTGTSNTLRSGITGDVGGTTYRFDVTCSAALEEVAVPLQGLVFADAESSGSNEWVQAQPLNALGQPDSTGATPRVIETGASAGCGQSATAQRTSDGRLRLSATAPCASGPMALGFMDGSANVRVWIKGGGFAAVAFGVVLHSDFGDAPATYGEAASLYQPGWDGGTPAVSDTAMTQLNSSFELATFSAPATRLGALVDAETANQAGASATTDDTNGAADEDGIAAPGTIDVVAGGKFTLEDVACTGPGYVAGWIDWDGEGVFDAGERSGAVECAGGSVDLTWDVPAGIEDLTSSYLRLRIAGTEEGVASPTGMTTAGEVEDYPLGIDVAELDVVKTSTASASTRVGDTVTYTVTATNNTPVDFTEAAPAVVMDNLAGVVDDATYNNDGVASQAGTVAYSEPVVSWSGALAAGGSVELTYSVTTKRGGDGVVRNVAWDPVNPTDPDGSTPPACTAPVEGQDTATGEPCASSSFSLPRLTITKTASRSELPAIGDSVGYTVTVTNPGPGVYSVAAPASFTDDLTGVLDAHSIYNGNAESGGVGTVSFDADTSVLSWSGPLGVGESATVTYSVTYTQDDADGDGDDDGTGDRVLRNAACVPTGQAMPGTSACDFTQVPAAGLTSWKQVEASDLPAVAGSELRYTLFFANDGQTAASVDSVDYLAGVLDDAEVSSVEAAAGLTAELDTDAQTIAVTGSVPVGGTLSVSYVATVKADGERGDDVVANFLGDPGSEPPVTCDPVDERFPGCTSTPVAAITYSKSVSAGASPVGAGSVLTYAVTLDSTGAVAAPVAREDVLTDVLDDADLVSGPVSDTDSVTVSEVSGGRFSLGGELAAGTTARVTYQVRVKPEWERGNNQASNYLVAPGAVAPVECVAGSTDCTSTPMPSVSVVKAADPVSGGEVAAGDEVVYTLTFTNSGTVAGPVDFTDDVSGVLDDAVITVAPADGSGVLTASAVDAGTGRFTVGGTLEPGQSASVTYTATVNPDGDRGDNRLGNVVAPSRITDPQCGDDGVVCTSHTMGELDDWKVVDPASGGTVVPGGTATYTLFFENTGTAPVVVDRDDVLTGVLDDADVTTEPTASSDSLAVSEIEDGRFTVAGDLAAGERVTVSYTVTVKPDGERGDDAMGNFLVPAGEDPPATCEPADAERADCTVTYVSNVTVAKTSDPASGTTVDPGGKVTYTLTFTNVSTNAASPPVAVDYTDHLTDVLDDATLVGEASVSNGDLTAVVEGSTLQVTGVVPAAATYTLTYTVTVKDWDDQGNHSLGNVVAVTGTSPVCVAGSPLCTTNPVAQPPMPDTGANGTLTTSISALLILGLGTALAHRRRRNA